MNPEQELRSLERQIREHNRAYYQEDNPLISDSEYDQMFRRLQALEGAHPELRSPDSPSQRVGAPPVSAFEKVEHATPMLSLQNAMDEEEVREFDARVRRFLGGKEGPIEYVRTEIMDLPGTAYRGGVLDVTATRGNGAAKMTPNVKTIREIPCAWTVRTCPRYWKYGVRHGAGEFEQMNTRRLEHGEVFANPGMPPPGDSDSWILPFPLSDPRVLRLCGGE